MSIQNAENFPIIFDLPIFVRYNRGNHPEFPVSSDTKNPHRAGEERLLTWVDLGS